jgi:mono/diheme cytochrome c family protein
MNAFFKACFASCLLSVVAMSANADEAQRLAGTELYAEYCESCHGPERSGLPEFNLDLAGLTNRLEGVTESMPDFAGFFEADEIAALYAYLSAPLNEN